MSNKQSILFADDTSGAWMSALALQQSLNLESFRGCEWTVRALHLKDYDCRLRRYYLSFDFIVSSWRFNLLDLAIYRQVLHLAPRLILCSGMPTLSRVSSALIRDKICDIAIGKPVDLQTWKQILSSEPLESQNASFGKLAAIVFIGYLFRGPTQHDQFAEWAKGPVDLAFESAYQAYKDWVQQSLQGNNSMIIRPAFPLPERPSSPQPTNRCFVIMPFAADLQPVYERVVKPTVQAAGFEIGRADDFFTQGSVMDDIWNRLNDCDFVIADLTRRNPNVFYELGIADTLGKPVILLTQNLDDVPFDLRHKRVIKYGINFTEVEATIRNIEESLKAIRDTISKSRGLGTEDHRALFTRGPEQEVNL